MPHISLNATAQGLTPAEPGPPLGHRLAAALAAAPGKPVVVMIHGYRYAPHRPHANPHTHILALQPRLDCRKAISWPRHLGFGRSPDEGVAIGFGWQANGSLWRAYHVAEQAGQALACLIGQIAQIDPARRVDVVAHSLGARVLFAALPLVAAGTVGRVILMAGADFQSCAVTALQTPAGRMAEVFNITTRENDLFDAALELLIKSPVRGDRALGQGLATSARNWLDIQVDQARTLGALAALGHRIAPPHLRVCHWSAYLRPGLFALYRALLTEPASLPLALLRAHLPGAADPRWSRLFARPTLRLPLPLRRNASS